MKVALIKKLSYFWEPDEVKEDSMTKTSCDNEICHEVKYNPTDKKSQSYKLHIKPFLHGTAKQWLKFMDKLNIVIHGNGLNNEDGPVGFNMTSSSLKGKALGIFNDNVLSGRMLTSEM
jgi:hypothetical protein